MVRISRYPERICWGTPSSVSTFHNWWLERDWNVGWEEERKKVSPVRSIHLGYWPDINWTTSRCDGAVGSTNTESRHCGKLEELTRSMRKEAPRTSGWDSGSHYNWRHYRQPFPLWWKCHQHFIKDSIIPEFTACWPDTESGYFWSTMKRSKDSTTHGVMSYLVYQLTYLCSQNRATALRHEMLISSILLQRNSPKTAIFIHATNIYKALCILEPMLDAGDKEAAKGPQMLWTKSIRSQWRDESKESLFLCHTPHHSLSFHCRPTDLGYLSPNAIKRSAVKSYV